MFRISPAMPSEKDACAQIYAQLGHKEAALAALKRAWEVRDAGLLEIKVDPFLDPLRTDSRFTSLVRRVGFAV